jgi:hypothetical protein
VGIYNLLRAAAFKAGVDLPERQFPAADIYVIIGDSC